MDPDKLKETKNTSILAPVYYYKIAKRDFGSTSRFFRVMMEGYIKNKYGNLVKSEDIISDEELRDVLISEKEQETSFVKDTVQLVKENHVETDINDLETEAVIDKTLQEEKEKVKQKWLEHKDYLEQIIQRAVLKDVVPPFDYIEKEYGINEDSVFKLIEEYEKTGIFNFELISTEV